MRHAEHCEALLESLRDVDREVLVRCTRCGRRVEGLWLVCAGVENGSEVLRDVFTRVLLTVLESDRDADLGRSRLCDLVNV